MSDEQPELPADEPGVDDPGVDEPSTNESEADGGADGGADGPGEASSARRPRVGLAAWLLLAAAVVAVVAAYLFWRSADGDPDLERAALRDQALIDGTRAVETMTSMDHRDVEAGIKAWQSVSTGVLRDQLMAVTGEEQEMLADQGKIASGQVVKAALTDLNDRTATLIVAVEVTVRADEAEKEPAVKRNRFSADLVLVDGEWKIENLTQVAVSL